jgi:hypothetical protein
MIITVLLVVALLAFLVAAFELPPPVSSVRLIALGLFLLTLCQLIGAGGAK